MPSQQHSKVCQTLTPNIGEIASWVDYWSSQIDHATHLPLRYPKYNPFMICHDFYAYAWFGSPRLAQLPEITRKKPSGVLGAKLQQGLSQRLFTLGCSHRGIHEGFFLFQARIHGTGRFTYMKTINNQPLCIASWWFQPIWKILVKFQIGSFPQVGLKIKNVWNHQLDRYVSQPHEYYGVGILLSLQNVGSSWRRCWLRTVDPKYGSRSLLQPPSRMSPPQNIKKTTIKNKKQSNIV